MCDYLSLLPQLNYLAAVAAAEIYTSISDYPYNLKISETRLRAVMFSYRFAILIQVE
jgi:hypothetical protein